MRYQEKNSSINRAIALANKGEHVLARQLLEQEIANGNSNNFLLINLASICFVLKDMLETEKHLDQFLLSNETIYTEFYFNATSLYSGIAQYQKAISCAKKLTTLIPEDLSAQALLAEACFDAKDTEHCIQLAENILIKSPGNYDLKSFLANLYSGKGEFLKAEQLYRETLSSKFDHSYACAGLSKCRKFINDNNEVLSLFEKALQSQHDVDTEARIRFAIAKLHNDVDDFDAAWLEAEKANNLQATRVPFDQQQYQHYIDQLIKSFSTTDYEARSTDSEPVPTNKSPILIVGMPRSGTTLTEQILSKDPDIYPGGEKQGLDYTLLLTFGEHDYFNEIHHAEDSVFIEMANTYKDYFSRFSNFSGTRIVDKVPSNYLHLGIFVKMFPNIRIINLKRNPLDIASSIFFENFSFKLNYTNSIKDIIFVYQQYVRLMDFWQSRFPQNILTIEYEQLTQDHQQQKQNIIEFCQLKLNVDDDHISSNNLVDTPSSWQVRQGIYRSSIDRWKRYEKFLLPYQSLSGK